MTKKRKELRQGLVVGLLRGITRATDRSMSKRCGGAVLQYVTSSRYSTSKHGDGLGSASLCSLLRTCRSLVLSSCDTVGERAPVMNNCHIMATIALMLATPR